MSKYKVRIDGQEFTVEIGNMSDRLLNVTVNDNQYSLDIQRLTSILPDNSGGSVKPDQAQAPRPAPASAPQSAAVSSPGNNAKSIKAPMPGAILQLYVSPGDMINAGQKVALLEAMKMENDIFANTSGKIQEVKVKVGDSVQTNQVLMVLE